LLQTWTEGYIVPNYDDDDDYYEYDDDYYYDDDDYPSVCMGWGLYVHRLPTKVCVWGRGCTYIDNLPKCVYGVGVVHTYITYPSICMGWGLYVHILLTQVCV